jgi:hypothetical protein
MRHTQGDPLDYKKYRETMNSAYKIPSDILYAHLFALIEKELRHQVGFQDRKSTTDQTFSF